MKKVIFKQGSKEVFSIFFDIVLIVLILVIYRKQRTEFTKVSKTEIIFCLSWYLFYMILAIISCALSVNIINEAANWLFLVLFPLLIIVRLRKENVIKTLKEIGLKRMDIQQVIKILLVCMIYISVIILVFCLGDEKPNILKMMAKFPMHFCYMLFTAAFTEEFFFRGIVQNCMMNALKRPYIAILLASVLFGLYHFPFAFYLWEETAGSIVKSLKLIMTSQAVSGCALGFIYYKSNKNLWSSIILHALANAAIMSLSAVFSGSI